MNKTKLTPMTVHNFNKHVDEGRLKITKDDGSNVVEANEIQDGKVVRLLIIKVLGR
jgi:hypothetical protein